MNSNADLHEHLTLLETYIRENYSLNRIDSKLLCNTVFMSAFRNEINIDELLDDIIKGSAFNLENFVNRSEGYIFDYVLPKYKPIAESVANCKAGSNGGMANVGKGEWITPFFAPQKAKLLKNGRGDIHYTDNNINEEWKWNGGRTNATEESGREIRRRFYDCINEKGCGDLLQNDEKWVPLRVTKRIRDRFTEDTLKKLNAIWWEAVSGDVNESLDDNGLKKMLLTRAATSVFETSDTLLICNDDGKFVRFKTKEDVINYYSDHIDKLGFEIRANQSNKVAMYVHVYD